MGECDIVMFALRSLLGKIGRDDWIPKADMKDGSKGDKAYLNATNINYPVMQSVNSLRLDDYLLHMLSILSERAERNKDFEVDDLLPCSEEMKSWFSAV